MERNQVSIGNDLQYILAHFIQIVAQQQGTLGQGPQGKMRLGFFQGQGTIANF
jgi:hypothetical protein